MGFTAFLYPNKSKKKKLWITNLLKNATPLLFFKNTPTDTNTLSVFDVNFFRTTKAIVKNINQR